IGFSDIHAGMDFEHIIAGIGAGAVDMYTDMFDQFFAETINIAVQKETEDLPVVLYFVNKIIGDLSYFLLTANSVIQADLSAGTGTDQHDSYTNKQTGLQFSRYFILGASHYPVSFISWHSGRHTSRSGLWHLQSFP